jgi:ubiquinone/menaquinone biosynthesis C-methylase UbiE
MTDMTQALKYDHPHAAVCRKDLKLPEYASMLAAYHRAYAPELHAIINTLPLRPDDRVLDMECGDGTYAPWVASHMGNRGMLIGADISLDYLRLAQQQVAQSTGGHRIHLTVGDVERLPFADS